MLAQPCPPVLLIVFKRPDVTQKVFARIREARPAQFFVAADGPRPDHFGEEQLCAATRQVVQQVDWASEVKTLFRDNNLGCGRGVSSAIDWFFEHVESGIILEDDCLPSESFFSFCGQMLSHYRHDTRVVSVSGTNVLGRWKETSNAYLFSYYGGNWGWATWRRAWRLFDDRMTLWQTPANRKYLEYVLANKAQADSVATWFNSVSGNKRPDVWDYQWFCSRLMSSGLNIVPAHNLVSNIGFGEAATHTRGSSALMNLPRYTIELPVAINPIVVVDRRFDAENARIYGLSRQNRLQLAPLAKLASCVKNRRFRT